MTTVKKGLRTVLVLAFFLGIKMSYAQEQTAKAADATEVASATKEVKPVIPVPASLAKAMVAAKMTGKKEAGKKKGVKNQETITYYYTSNTTDDANLPGSWTDVMPEGHSCGTGQFPCEVTLDADEFPTIEDFIDGRDASTVAADPRIDRTSEPAQ